jgi:hypothetical protein
VHFRVDAALDLAGKRSLLRLPAERARALGQRTRLFEPKER